MNYLNRVLVTVLALGSTSVYATDKQLQGGEEAGNMVVGALVASSKSIYVGGEDKTRLLPFISGEWGAVYLQGASLGYKWAESKQATLSTSLELDGLFSQDRDDSPELQDMKEVGNVFMAALNYDYRTDFGEFGLSLAADLGGEHKGYKAKLSYGYGFMVGPLMVQPEIAVEWVSEEVNNYYYGVSQQDVKAGRPFYQADAGVNYQFGVNAIYPIDRKQAIMLRAGVERYSDEVTDSPIVDEDTSTFVGLGYTYRF